MSTAVANISSRDGNVAALIDRAAAGLQSARTSAELLDVIGQTVVAYTAAKLAARAAKIKGAFDEVVAAAYRAQADALEIEAAAKRRLADEYDGAQERGEVKSSGQPRKSIVPNENNTPSVSDIGLTRKQVHEARQLRDAEKANPGIIRKTLDTALRHRAEPTKAAVRRAVDAELGKSRKPAKVKEYDDDDAINDAPLSRPSDEETKRIYDDASEKVRSAVDAYLSLTRKERDTAWQLINLYDQ